MSYLNDLYLRLCMSTVFKSITEEDIFKHFEDFCNATKEDEKIKAYASFVADIYDSGLSLSKLVLKLVLEDENVYIKSRAKALPIDKYVTRSVKEELKNFEEFSRVSSDLFGKELNSIYLSDYPTEKLDFVALYEERIKNVNKLGYGIFSSYPMFRLSASSKIEPIISADKTDIDCFVGYENERSKVIANTRAFLEGKPAANVLLCGDAGTGKSSTVKAVANSFYDNGLRLIELRKDQLSELPYVMGKINDNPLKFIIFIDDLSFNKSDDNFSMLKAALEGSASAKANNAVIYATSNRRHIIKESFADRTGDDVHINDTMQELLSLSERFGLVVLFSKPDKKLYLDIVHELAERFGIDIDKNQLDIMAESFALRRGNRSARCAEQFVCSLL